MLASKVVFLPLLRGTFLLKRSPVDGSQGGMRTALVDEDEPSGIDPFGHYNPPGGSQELVALAGFHAPFCGCASCVRSPGTPWICSPRPLPPSAGTSSSRRAWRRGALGYPPRAASLPAHPVSALSRGASLVPGTFPPSPSRRSA